MSRVERKIEEKTMKVERLKNPYFWIGIIGVILTSLQVEASSLTSWGSVGKLIVNTVSNPYLLGTTVMALVGVLVNPTTKGLTD